MLRPYKGRANTTCTLRSAGILPGFLFLSAFFQSFRCLRFDFLVERRAKARPLQTRPDALEQAAKLAVPKHPT